MKQHVVRYVIISSSAHYNNITLLFPNFLLANGLESDVHHFFETIFETGLETDRFRLL